MRKDNETWYHLRDFSQFQYVKYKYSTYNNQIGKFITFSKFYTEHIIVGNKAWYTQKELKELNFSLKFDDLDHECLPVHDKDLIMYSDTKEMLDIRIELFMKRMI